jgi:hypothetical protein
MGWTESPKIFTSATETVADISNADLAAGTVFGPHRLDAQSESKSPGPASDIAIANEVPLLVAPDPAMEAGGATYPASVSGATPASNASAPLVHSLLPLADISHACPPSMHRGARPQGKVHYGRPLTSWDVYVDDFLGLVQGGVRTRRWVNHALLHTLDTILHLLDDHGYEY